MVEIASEIMDIGKRLRKIRIDKGGKDFWSIRSVANRAGLSNSYLSQIETGQVKQPSVDTIKCIAEALRYPTIELLKELGYVPEDPPDQKTIKIPILGFTPAGQLSFIIDEVVDWLELNFDLVKDRSAFALRVKGDCMKDAGIFNGDLVIVSKTATVSNGNIAVVNVDGECTCKKYFKNSDDQIILQPMNPEYNPIVVDLKKHNVEIIGKVINAFKSFA